MALDWTLDLCFAKDFAAVIANHSAYSRAEAKPMRSETSGSASRRAAPVEPDSTVKFNNGNQARLREHDSLTKDGHI
ncbi:MAG TPA: hypothetical protein VLL57_12840 [Candidatus Binataceae bacterium]|nr:hypothetical protein [Candidatus Binataceae bacterium]